MNVRANKVQQSLLKRTIKRGMQYFAASFGRHTRTTNEPRLLILMYHRILPLNDQRSLFEEPGMTVTPETFKQHINILKKYFDIVKLSEWIQMQQDGKELPQKACAITFDDGWADNFEFAFPILKELNVPATIFLVSDMIGTKEIFWPERLARLVVTIAREYPQHWSHPELKWLQNNPKNYHFSDMLPTREELSALIADAKNYSDQEIRDRITRIEETLQLAGDDNRPSLLDWQQVAEMVDSGLVEIGSHTCRHVRLNENTPGELLKHEVIGSKKTIEEHIGQSIKTFCFPNGDFCPQALELVEQNYIGAVSTQSGWNTSISNMHLLQRIGMHQDISEDKTSFLARISGWM